MSSDTEQIPNSWGITSLERVCEILDSIRIPINAKERNERIANKNPSELYPYYGATGKVGTIDGYLFEGEHLLLGEDGAPFLDHTKDTAYLASGKFWVNNHAHILKAYISNKYLCHYLNQFDFTESVTGTTRLKLNQASLKEIPVWFAPENEQHRIVAKIEELFSELDKGIESLKRAREQLKVYRQALLKHAFEGKLTEQWRKDNAGELETADQLLERIKQEREARYQQQLEEWKAAVKQWEADGKEAKKPSKPKPLKEFPSIAETELKELPEIPNGWLWIRLGNLFQDSPKNGVYKPSSEYGRGNYIVRIDDFYDGNLIRLNGFKRLNLSDDELEKYLLDTGDILINRVNSIEYLGKCCEVKSLDEAAVFESNIMKLKTLADLVLGGYLTSCLASHEGRNRLCSNAKHAVNQASINQTDVSMTPIPVCSVPEQHKIKETLGSQLSVMSALIEDVDQNLLRSEALRQSILKKAFSGQLVPQDPDDEPASVLLDRIAKEKEEACLAGRQAAAKAKKAKAAKRKTKKRGSA